MSKKLICLAFVLALVSSASADLVGHWPLDGDANDVSGNGLHGTIILADPNAVPSFVDGAAGQALVLSGADYVNIDGYTGINADRTDPDNPFQKAFSVSLWINTTSNGSLVNWGSSDGAGVGGQYQNFRIDGGRLRAEHGNGRFRGAATVNDGEWHHVVMSVAEGSNLFPPGTKLFVDGVQDAQGDDTVNAQNIWNLTEDAEVTIGRRASHGDRYLAGMFDDVRIYDHALTQGEIREQLGLLTAYGLDPADGAVIEETSVTLSWTPGPVAAAHDVYLGASPELGEAELVGRQTDASYLVDDPTLGQTYYWRIDDIEPADDPNDPNAVIVHTGAVASFFIPPMAAYDLSPADGQADVLVEEVSWIGGWSPLMHAVYVGTTAADVTNGLVEPTILIRGDTSLDIGPLELGTTYYWAVDEFYGDHWSVGETLSFTTAPDVPADPNADPNLVAHWKFDEGMGTTALDSSGNNYHALLVGDVNWISPGAVEDEGGSALEFTTTSQYGAISGLNYESTGIPEISVFAWIRTANEGDQYIISLDRNEYYRLEINGNGAGPGQVGWDVWTDAGQIDYGSETRVDDDEWHHIGGVFDNGTATIYIDGKAEPSTTMGTTMGTGNLRYGFIGLNSEATSFNGSNGGGSPVSFLDDLRIYDRAFSAADVRQTFSNAAAASQPDPVDGATGLSTIVSLMWLPGDGAVSHDVHIGTDAAAVAAGDAFAGNVVSMPVILGFGLPPDPFVGGLTPGTTYYWRIDEIDADGNVTPGPVWSFSL